MVFSSHQKLRLSEYEFYLIPIFPDYRLIIFVFLEFTVCPTFNFCELLFGILIFLLIPICPHV